MTAAYLYWPAMVQVKMEKLLIRSMTAREPNALSRATL